MPYVVELFREDVVFPSHCPFCAKRSGTNSIERYYAKASASVVGVSERKWLVRYPVCDVCIKTFRWLLILGFVVLALGWISFFGLTYLDVLRSTTGLGIAGALTVVSIAVFLYRRWRLGAFRVAYVGDRSTVFAIRRRTTAEDFATLNKSRSRWKLAVVRFS